MHMRQLAAYAHNHLNTMTSNSVYMSVARNKKDFLSRLEELPIRNSYIGSNKLEGKTAIITGGDSGIGSSVAVHFAREGANIAIVYLHSDDDALHTKKLVEEEGAQCMLLKGDVSKELFCKEIADKVHEHFGGIDVLVNNAGTHEEDEELGGISRAQLVRTFEVNIFPFFYLTTHALEHMHEGSCIINTTSVTAYRGSDHLIDYAATKGAIVSFTRSLALNLAKQGIRVNGVAPGPVWTPLVVHSFDAEHLEQFGKDTPLGRAAYPYEIAPAFVYLACNDSSYMTGQVLHVNGGEIVNG